MDNKSIINRIRTLRIERNFSQENMADELGITYGAYSKWENNKTRLNIDNLNRLADILKVPVEYILLGNSYNKEAHQESTRTHQEEKPKGSTARRIYELELNLKKAQDEISYLRQLIKDLDATNADLADIAFGAAEEGVQVGRAYEKNLLKHQE